MTAPADVQSGAAAPDKYLSGDYAERHPGWHLNDAEIKARELLPGVTALARKVRDPVIVDVGTGVGGVPAALQRMLPDVGGSRPRLIGFEIAEYAVRKGRELFPDLDLQHRALEATDGPFDATMFADVLEHLENPWEMLRRARGASRHLLVRQPLLDNFGLFRHDKYRKQRETLGHISFFNYRSFIDMAAAAGWRPHTVAIVAPWQMGVRCGPLRPAKQLLARLAPETTSFLLEGFYLTGLFEGV
jgi:hypothetical protein